jgi:hypothetical protein
MPRVPFDQLPGDARLWVFPASRALDAAARSRLLDTVDAFLDGWAAHGVPLTSGRELRHDRFLLVAVDEKAAGASGCSIDAMVRSLRALERELDLALTDHGPVWFRAGDTFRRVPRDEFRSLAERGAVSPETVVFDNTVTTVGAVRAGAWEAPAARTWHGRLFFGAARRP